MCKLKFIVTGTLHIVCNQAIRFIEQLPPSYCLLSSSSWSLQIHKVSLCSIICKHLHDEHFNDTVGIFQFQQMYTLVNYSRQGKFMFFHIFSLAERLQDFNIWLIGYLRQRTQTSLTLYLIVNHTLSQG